MKSMGLSDKMSTLVDKLAPTKKELAPIPRYRWQVVTHNLEHGKRVYPRKKVFGTVYYAISDKSFFGWIYNLSEGGVFIRTGEPLSPRTDVTLDFTMPKSNIPKKVKGEVMWIGQNGMGLKFKEVDESTKDKIKSVLSRT